MSRLGLSALEREQLQSPCRQKSTDDLRTPRSIKYEKDIPARRYPYWQQRKQIGSSVSTPNPPPNPQPDTPPNVFAICCKL